MMEKLTTPAMIDGVQRSAVFLLFVNRDTLSRPYVVLEFAVALALDKPIVLVYETDARRAAPRTSSVTSTEIRFSALTLPVPKKRKKSTLS